MTEETKNFVENVQSFILREFELAHEIPYYPDNESARQGYIEALKDIADFITNLVPE